MGLLNRGKRIRDERIEGLVNKVYKEAFILAVVFALGSMLVKFYRHGLDIRLALPEIIIIAVPSVYHEIRTAFLGVYLDEVESHDRTSRVSRSTKNTIVGIVSGLAVATFFGIRSSLMFGNETNRIWYFVLVFFAALMIYLPAFVFGISLVDTAARKAGRKNARED